MHLQMALLDQVGQVITTSIHTISMVSVLHVVPHVNMSGLLVLDTLGILSFILNTHVLVRQVVHNQHSHLLVATTFVNLVIT